MKIFTVFAIPLLVSLTGCFSISDPHISYSDKTHPIEDTAVYVPMGYRNYNTFAQVISVDGKDIGQTWDGRPFWVRVRPGAHSFMVRYTTNYFQTMNMSGSSTAYFNIKIEDMKPRHVYLTKYIRNGNRVSTETVDLGENPDFTLKKGSPIKFAN